MHSRSDAHDHLVDIWGLGTIMLFLINSQEMSTNPASGFVNLTQAELYAIILKACMQSKAHLELPAQDFIRRCCQVVAQNRMSACEAQAHPWFSDPRHLKLLEIVKATCRDSWEPASGIFPPTDVLPDLAPSATRREEDEPAVSSVVSSTAGGITASQYFSSIDAVAPDSLPTPPGMAPRPSLPILASLTMRKNVVEVPCTPFDGRGEDGRQKHSQASFDSQDMIPASIVMSSQRQREVRHESIYF